MPDVSEYESELQSALDAHPPIADATELRGWLTANRDAAGSLPDLLTLDEQLAAARDARRGSGSSHHRRLVQRLAADVAAAELAALDGYTQVRQRLLDQQARVADARERRRRADELAERMGRTPPKAPPEAAKAAKAGAMKPKPTRGPLQWL